MLKSKILVLWMVVQVGWVPVAYAQPSCAARLCFDVAYWAYLLGDFAVNFLASGTSFLAVREISDDQNNAKTEYLVSGAMFGLSTIASGAVLFGGRRSMSGYCSPWINRAVFLGFAATALLTAAIGAGTNLAAYGSVGNASSSMVSLSHWLSSSAFLGHVLPIVILIGQVWNAAIAQQHEQVV